MFLFGQTVAQGQATVAPLLIWLPPNSFITAQARSTGALTVSLAAQSNGQASSTLAPVAVMAAQSAGQGSASAVLGWVVSGQTLAQGSVSAIGPRVALAYPFPPSAITVAATQAQSTAGLAISLAAVVARTQASADASLSLTPVIGLTTSATAQGRTSASLTVTPGAFVIGQTVAQATVSAGLSVAFPAAATTGTGSSVTQPRVSLSVASVGQASSSSAPLSMARGLVGQTLAQGSATGALTSTYAVGLTSGARVLDGCLADQPVAAQRHAGRTRQQPILPSGIIYYRLVSGQSVGRGQFVVLAMDVDRREGTIDGGQVIVTGGSIPRSARARPRAGYHTVDAR